MSISTLRKPDLTEKPPLDSSRKIYSFLGVSEEKSKLSITSMASSGASGSHPDRQEWIDGLRGLASLQVAIFHTLSDVCWSFYRSPWADNSQLQMSNFFRVVPVRVLAHGPGMVRLFFVISGYCIGISLESTTQCGSKSARASITYYRKLTSAMVRRWLRLYLPLAVIAILCQILWFLDFYAEEPSDLRDLCPDARPWLSPWSHLTCTITYLVNALDVVNLRFTHGLHNTLWTVPVDARGSMQSYLTLLGLANTRRRWRIVVLAALVFYQFWFAAHEMQGYMFGLLVVEVQRAMALNSRYTATSRTCLRISSVIALVAGLYLISLPPQQHTDATEVLHKDYFFFKSLWLPHWHNAGEYTWQAYFLGAFLVFPALLGLPRCRSYLCTPPLQFLGRISFSLFLVHAAIIRTLRARLITLISEMLHAELPVETHPASFSWMLANGIAVVITVLGAVASALVFREKVEAPMLRCARQIEKHLALPERKDN
ncbi:hypothetical protein CBER1_10045 [Cercospora berteroae]|uniref:Acyltransferase 3 domain-containing protein n=1 Tax=Cercospora berteroae TaxID=357750 RepID=A0A2S6BX71_9PEZI|nr:hypothetical protein CBER1_10045 [Cercospora berteroae]